MDSWMLNRLVEIERMIAAGHHWWRQVSGNVSSGSFVPDDATVIFLLTALKGANERIAAYECANECDDARRGVGLV